MSELSAGMQTALRRVTGWGQYPSVDSKYVIPDVEGLAAVLSNSGTAIARGLGRSYGDSSLASLGGTVVETTRLDSLLSFDAESGILSAGAGISLRELARIFIPQGWFVPVTPGTSYITLGGAVASDVHGKNHHRAGSFGNYVERLELMLAGGEVITISRQQHPELFWATVGGMGLTGIILTVTVRLTRMRSSNIVQRSIKAPNLDAVLEGFAEHALAPYSVAWVDTTARGAHLGRSILMLGEEARDGVLEVASTRQLPVPFRLPNMALNPVTIRGFNWLYYHKNLQHDRVSTVPYQQFYYQLDAASNWHRLYGSRGFSQYQFVIPETASRDGSEGLRSIIQEISDAGLGSPITVLKKFGAGNESLLGFPEPGYTLAVDFGVYERAFALMNRLDSLVLASGGKLYLSKDSRMSADMFRQSYPNWQEFQRVREQYGALGKFASAQSQRLGLEA